jgi:hypothetical protein
MNGIKEMERTVWARPRRDRHLFVKMLALTFAVVVFACWALGGLVPQANAFNEPLRFTENGTFQISIFEDLHFGEGMSISPPLKIKY